MTFLRALKLNYFQISSSILASFTKSILTTVKMLEMSIVPNIIISGFCTV